jgi:uncharacterized membrane protein YoaK (UPF0700 family)
MTEFPDRLPELQAIFNSSCLSFAVWPTLPRERRSFPVLIQRGEARDPRLDRRLAFILAGVAGSLNAAAYHAVGFFAGNMTGNVSTLSSLIALGQWGHGLFYLAVVATFIAGSALSSLAIETGLRLKIATIYAHVVLVEAGLLAVLGVSAPLLAAAERIACLILGLSFLMGLQNAIVTHISDARVRTTHISGMATDVGIGLARLIARDRGSEEKIASEHGSGCACMWAPSAPSCLAAWWACCFTAGAAITPSPSAPCPCWPSASPPCGKPTLDCTKNCVHLMNYIKLRNN